MTTLETILALALIAFVILEFVLVVTKPKRTAKALAAALYDAEDAWDMDQLGHHEDEEYVSAKVLFIVEYILGVRLERVPTDDL